MVFDFNYWSKVGKKFFCIGISILLFYLVLKLSVFYLPFLISFVLALIIEPLIRFLMKRFKWTRRFSSLMVIFFSITAIMSVIGWGASTLFNEANNILEGADNFFHKLNDFISNFSRNDYLLEKIPDELKVSLESAEAEYINSINKALVDFLNSIKSWIGKVPSFLTAFFFSLVALYFLCTDKIYMIDQAEHHLPDNWYRKIIVHTREISKKLTNYLKAEILLIIISFMISFIGLFIFKLFGLNIKYPLIFALGIGFVDALPILGSGTVMIPWAIWEAINGDLALGISIIGLWIFMTIVKNVLEPKLVSKNIGIHPILTIIAMYTGFKLLGIMGMIIGPVLLIVLKEIFTPLLDKGVFKVIFDRNY